MLLPSAAQSRIHKSYQNLKMKSNHETSLKVTDYSWNSKETKRMMDIKVRVMEKKKQ